MSDGYQIMTYIEIANAFGLASADSARKYATSRDWDLALEGNKKPKPVRIKVPITEIEKHQQTPTAVLARPAASPPKAKKTPEERLEGKIDRLKKRLETLPVRAATARARARDQAGRAEMFEGQIDLARIDLQRAEIELEIRRGKKKATA